MEQPTDIAKLQYKIQKLRARKKVAYTLGLALILLGIFLGLWGGFRIFNAGMTERYEEADLGIILFFFGSGMFVFGAISLFIVKSVLSSERAKLEEKFNSIAMKKAKTPPDEITSRPSGDL